MGGWVGGGLPAVVPTFSLSLLSLSPFLLLLSFVFQYVFLLRYESNLCSLIPPLSLPSPSDSCKENACAATQACAATIPTKSYTSSDRSIIGSSLEAASSTTMGKQ